MQNTKPIPRFVPTLTEVVRPGAVAQDPWIDREALVRQVLETLRPRLEQQLRTALHAVVEEELRKANSQWLLDVDSVVNSAVDRAMAKRSPTES